MADRITSEARSRLMARIRGKDTKPEMIIRKILHAHGFRYRLHVKNMPGHPDMVFHKYRAVVMVNGCFWHGHSCHIFRMPKSRIDYWETKIKRNMERDKSNKELLFSLGWRIATIWECAVIGKTSIPIENTIELITGWLKGNEQELNLEGISHT